MDSKKMILSNNSLNRRLFFLMALSFFAGEVIGTAVFCGNMNDGIFIIEKFSHNSVETSLGQAVINSFAGPAVFVILCAWLGAGAFFQPAEFVVPLFYGLGSGILLADLNYGCGVKDAVLICIVTVPHIAVSAITVIIASREAICMSNAVLNNVLSHREVRKINLELYITKYIILLVILLLSALADGAVKYFYFRITE